MDATFPLLKTFRGLILFAVCMLPFLAAQQKPPQDQDAARRESVDRYYQKWLGEDVAYIITEQERAVFLELTSPDEKDQFIEQFWRRRDTDPSTIHNEYKEEHYRRISYVNERYFSGVPGWRTDRGKIYIRFGEPDSIEKAPYGGPYRRRPSEGGGETTTFPWERWWYRHIPGVGEDVELEFVDKGFSNEYRLSVNPNDKDAFLFTPGHGNTQEEWDGNWSRIDRISAGPLGVVDPNFALLHRGDLPFEKLHRWAQIQQAPELRHQHLQEVISADVSYEQLPFRYRVDWLRMGQRALVPVTLGVEHRDLTFGSDGLGGEARVAFYGRVKNLSGQVVTVFEDEIVQNKAKGEDLKEGKSFHQKMLVLEPGRYRLDLILEDQHGSKRGTLQTGFVIPKVPDGQLTSSPMILVERAQPVSGEIDLDAPPEMFVLGTLRVLPRFDEVFVDPIYSMFYLQFYNFGIDSATQLPHLDLTYQLVDEGQVVVEKKDSEGKRASYVSDQRVAVLEYLDLRKARTDRPILRVHVEDRISGQSLTIEQPLKLKYSDE